MLGLIIQDDEDELDTLGDEELDKLDDEKLDELEKLNEDEELEKLNEDEELLKLDDDELLETKKKNAFGLLSSTIQYGSRQSKAISEAERAQL